jgi:hypothetical protein
MLDQLLFLRLACEQNSKDGWKVHLTPGRGERMAWGPENGNR